MPERKYPIFLCSVEVTDSKIKPTLSVVIKQGSMRLQCEYLVPGTTQCLVPGNPVCRIGKYYIESGILKEVELKLKYTKRGYVRRH